MRVGVIGATGYTGEELVMLLTGHKKVKLTYVCAIVEREVPLAALIPRFSGRCDLICKKPDSIEEAMDAVDLVFLALPHKISMKIAPKFLDKGKKVIDLSADYRISPDAYREWYGAEHTDVKHLKTAVYGLPELFREEIKKADLIANPGCYPTGMIVPLAPLLKEGLIEPEGIIADSKSGVTGAGRKADVMLSFAETNENVKAYKLHSHQHKPEVDKVLSGFSGDAIDIVFTPHLVPMNRGILSTIYAKPKKGVTTELVLKALRECYKGRAFIKVYEEGTLPQVKDVRMTNCCAIGASVKGGVAIIVSCIDNLLKGAAGQAVQNMNEMYDYEETEGLL